MSFSSELLEKIELMLLNKADKDVQSYQVAGRSLSKYTIKELMDLRSQLKAEVEYEALQKSLKKKGIRRIKAVRYV